MTINDNPTVWLTLGLLLFGVFLVFMANNSQAAWGGLPNYGGSYNISNVVWNYTQGSFSAKASMVVVSIGNIMVGSGFNVIGYGPSLQPLGNINYWILDQYGNNATIMLSNQTSPISGQRPWSLATIYYNTNPVSVLEPQGPEVVRTYLGTSYALVPSSLSRNGNFNLTPVSFPGSVFNFTIPKPA